MTTEERKRKCPRCGKTMMRFQAGPWEVSLGVKPFYYWQCRCGYWAFDLPPEMETKEECVPCQQ